MIHRVLCCADTHGMIPPMTDEAGALCWLHAGDCVHGPTARSIDLDLDEKGLRAAAADWFGGRSIPVFLVRGNHDVKNDLGAFRSAKNITGRVVAVAPHLFVAGIGWSGERFFELPRESDLEQVCQAVRRQALRLIMPGDSVILLTHYPPRFTEGRTVAPDPPEGGMWFESIRKLAEELRPMLIVEGHVHRWSRTSYSLSVAGRITTVVNPGPEGARLTLDLATRSVDVEWL